MISKSDYALISSKQIRLQSPRIENNNTRYSVELNGDIKMLLQQCSTFEMTDETSKLLEYSFELICSRVTETRKIRTKKFFDDQRPRKQQRRSSRLLGLRLCDNQDSCKHCNKRDSSQGLYSTFHTTWGTIIFHARKQIVIKTKPSRNLSLHFFKLHASL